MAQIFEAFLEFLNFNKIKDKNSTMCISSSQFYFVVAKTNNLYLHEMRVVVQLSKPASLLARPLSVFPK